MSLEIYVRINNFAVKRRKYLVDLGKPNGPRLSIYVSPDNLFTLAFRNSSGETYPVEIPMGAGGIPISHFVYIACEVGVGAEFSSLRVLMEGQSIVVNGKNVGSVELPFRVDVAALDMPNGVVGADLNGENGASFDLVSFNAFNATLFDSEIQRFQAAYKANPPNSFVQFKGDQWMRVKAVGAHDMQQPDKKHAPTFRKIPS
jgi:hypothetical protein